MRWKAKLHCWPAEPLRSGRTGSRSGREKTKRSENTAGAVVVPIVSSPKIRITKFESRSYQKLCIRARLQACRARPIGCAFRRCGGLKPNIFSTRLLARLKPCPDTNTFLDRSLRVLVPHHIAALHHKLHPLQRSHILERIAIDCNHVGPRAGLKASQFSRPSQQVR